MKRILYDDSGTTAIEWRPVAGFPYEVSNLGQVRRSSPGKRTSKDGVGRILVPTPCGTKNRYLQIALWSPDGGKKKFWIHRLVCEAFNGLPPSPKHEVAHIDGDGFNNVPSNLRWATRKENMADAIRLGRTNRGTKLPSAKLTEATVRAIREQIKRGISSSVIAGIYGISSGHVWDIGQRRRWGWLQDNAGVTSIEYGIIAALIAVVIITVLITVGSNLSGIFNTIATNL